MGLSGLGRGPAQKISEAIATQSDFLNASGNPRLSQYYLQSFGRDEQFSIHLIHRSALDLPGWIEDITGRDASHLYLSIRDPDGNELTQIHGLPHDDNGNSGITGGYDNHLRAVFDIRDVGEATPQEIESWSVSADELAVKLGQASQMGQYINDIKQPEYKPYWPFFQGTNSNTVARAMMQAMDLPLPSSVEGRWWNDGNIWAPGFANKDAFQMSDFNRSAFARYETGMSVEQAFENGLMQDMDQMTPSYVSAQVIKRHGDPEMLMAREHSLQRAGLAYS